MIDWFGMSVRRELREYKAMFNNYRNNYRELIQERDEVIAAQAKTIDTLTAKTSEQDNYIKTLENMVKQSEKARQNLAQKCESLADKAEQMSARISELRVLYEREREDNEKSMMVCCEAVKESEGNNGTAG